MTDRLALKDYDFLARYEARLTKPNGNMLFHINAVHDLVPDVKGKTLLDVGGGTNSYLCFTDGDYRKIATDFAPESLEGLNGVDTLQVELPATGLPSESADWVSAVGVLEHLPEEIYEASLQEIARVGKRYTGITCPFSQHLESANTKCPECGAVFQSEGHLRAYRIKDIFGLQDYFGGLVRLGFVGRPHTMTTKRIILVLQAFRHLLRKVGALDFAKPPLTKCPVCGREIFNDYEAYLERKRKQPDQNYWNVTLPIGRGTLVGNHFAAVFDREAAET